MTINFILFLFNLFFAFIDSNKYLTILNAFISGFAVTIFLYKAKEVSERNNGVPQE